MHLHGPSAQISQSSSLRLICQTARALDVFSCIHRVCKSQDSYPVARPLAVSARGSIIGFPSLQSSTAILVNVPYLHLTWDVSFQDSKSRILNRIDRRQERWYKKNTALHAFDLAFFFTNKNFVLTNKILFSALGLLKKRDLQRRSVNLYK